MLGIAERANVGSTWWYPRVTREVMRVILSMERVGLLFSGGYDYSQPMLGQVFWSNNGDRSQMSGSLWLAEVFGAEVIIPATTR